jgi:hypothetical protein
MPIDLGQIQLIDKISEFSPIFGPLGFAFGFIMGFSERIILPTINRKAANKVEISCWLLPREKTW